MIVGLTGKYAAGKGTIAELLLERGFLYHSLSDVLRSELATRGVPESREALLAIGNELRTQGGPGALAERIAQLLDDGDHIVDSIRNPAEVIALRRRDDFVLIGVDADQQTRFARLRGRGRAGDPARWEDFVALEAAETESDDPTKQQLKKTFELADHVVMNDAGVAELRASVHALLEQLAA